MLRCERVGMTSSSDTRSLRDRLSGNRIHILLVSFGGVLCLAAILLTVGVPGMPSVGPLADDGPGEAPNPDEVANQPTEEETPAEENATVYRVNVGGQMIPANDSTDWAADHKDDPYPYLNHRESDTVTTQTPDNITVEDDVSNDTPNEIFQSYRWDRNGGDEQHEDMTWEFPVDENREYEVRLYFVEAFFVEDEEDGRTPEIAYEDGGPRIFDVAVNDEIVLNQYEPFEEHGHDVGAVKTFEVTDHDGVITIQTLRGANSPVISGIEIVDIGPSDENGQDDEESDEGE